jgi:hypothetical protein
MIVTRAVLHVTTDQDYAERLVQRLGEMLGHSFICIEFRPGVYHVAPAPEFAEAFYAHWLDYYNGGTRMFVVLNPTP